MKRIFSAFAAALIMVSVTACGDSSSGSKSKSEKNSESSLSGTYYYADIDGFGFDEDKSKDCFIVFEDNGRFEGFLYSDSENDKEYYKEYGYMVKEPGSYDFSDGMITLTYDPITNKEELIEQYPCVLDNGYEDDPEREEEYFENQINVVAERREREKDKKYGIVEKQNSLYQVDDPYYYRKYVYKNLCQTIISDQSIYDILKPLSADESKYTFFSSDESLNENLNDQAKEEVCKNINELASACDNSYYIAEEGFSINFDLGKHSWFIVTKGSSLCAIVIGEGIDSEVFSSTGYYWTVAESGSGVLLDKDITDNFRSIRDVYNYYKSLS